MTKRINHAIAAVVTIACTLFPAVTAPAAAVPADHARQAGTATS